MLKVLHRENSIRPVLIHPHLPSPHPSSPPLTPPGPQPLAYPMSGSLGLVWQKIEEPLTEGIAAWAYYFIRKQTYIYRIDSILIHRVNRIFGGLGWEEKRWEGIAPISAMLKSETHLANYIVRYIYMITLAYHTDLSICVES